jgi:hypothetical protein
MVSVDRRAALFAIALTGGGSEGFRTVFNEGVGTESDHLQLNGITRAVVKFNTLGVIAYRHDCK